MQNYARYKHTCLGIVVGGGVTQNYARYKHRCLIVVGGGVTQNYA